MYNIDLKKQIELAIKNFNNGTLTQNSINLFESLGYNTERQDPLDNTNFKEFEESYIKNNSNGEKFDRNKALVSEWKYIDLLFQLSKQEVLKQISLFDTKRLDNTVIESYLFFAIELKEKEYSRSKLAQITREINKLFPMPVMVLFKYVDFLSLAVINRRLHKKDESKDVLEKVTLIKDIDIKNPHRGHIEIFFDLSIEELKKNFEFKNFVELHNAWQKTLDSSELNKKFYRDIANWYFWTVSNVTFPDDEIKNQESRNAISVIRLLTRLIFVWFLKEKNLIPEEIFDYKKLGALLKNLDDNESTYYKAILQNLFFATLNQEMNTSEKKDNRKFRNKKQNYNITNLYRYEDYFNDSKDFLKLMNDIPFLNGGLFECLDKKDKTNPDKVLRIDGFSDRDDNPLSFPNYLFFSEEKIIDLSKIYDDRKKQKEKFRGLIEILNHYKFTIHENTPIEEEVALDPELLGKVFENLLASYNPETKNTARNQTGSFYTPREIVDYMVTESLSTYLENSLKNTIKKANEEKQDLALSDKVRHLLSYTDEKHKFTDDETIELIKALDSCKIIDPACGSGAFPMGILHKMVYILGKLDPNNEKWKQKQIDKISEITDPNIKETFLNDIEEAFEHNELDYGRKLYLIENCIFGVDIQPIAVQISKLRVFISLVIDQRTNNKKTNLGIRPLPNLETKFVAGDSLVGIEKPKVMMLSLNMQKIDDLEKDLKKIREQHFSARTPKTKTKYREEDEKKRKEIADLLKEDGFNDKSTSILSNWNPYDQNSKADFFDMEWMFGIKVPSTSSGQSGFDIVIGNPPYVQIQGFKPEQKQLWKEQGYETFEATGDVYCLFYEQGSKLLKNNGILCFITSNKWMRANYGESLRTFFAEKTNPLKLLDFSQNLVFESAIVHSNILIFSKGKNENKLEACSILKDFNIKNPIDEYFSNMKVILEEVDSDIWNILTLDEYNIKKRIEKVGKLIKNWDISINYGIKTGFNEAFIIDGKKKDELIKLDPKNAEIIKPILRGRDVRKYFSAFSDLWIIFIPWHFPLHNDRLIQGNSLKAEEEFKQQYSYIYNHIEFYKKELSSRNKSETGIRYEWYALQRCAATYYKEFEKEKIVFSEIVSEPQFHLDKKGYYPEATTFFISGKNLKYLIALLNSAPVTYFFTKFYSGGELVGKYRYKKAFLENLPIPQISEKDQKPFEYMVDFVIFAKENRFETEANTIESVIDGMVYDLYFPEEMKNEDCYITDRVKEKISPFKKDDTDEFKKEYIKALNKFFLNDKIIYRGLIYRRFVNVVKIINGKKDE